MTILKKYICLSTNNAIKFDSESKQEKVHPTDYKYLFT